MSNKSRTDKILDLLDGALQSTTPRHHGAGYGSIEQEMCVGCLGKPPIEGRSWCERCLPENQPDYVAPDEPTTTDDALAFSYSIPLVPDDVIMASGAFAIYAGPDPGELPMAGIFVDDQNRPVGLGVNIGALFSLPNSLEVIEELGTLIANLTLDDLPESLAELLREADEP
jgi:hypothetical protein